MEEDTKASEHGVLPGRGGKGIPVVAGTGSGTGAGHPQTLC